MELNADEPDAKSGSRRRLRFRGRTRCEIGEPLGWGRCFVLNEELRTYLMLDQGVAGNVSNAS